MATPEIILALAREQGTSGNHLAKWKLRKYVPHPYRHALITFAATTGVTLRYEDLDWREKAPSEVPAADTQVAA